MTHAVYRCVQHHILVLESRSAPLYMYTYMYTCIYIGVVTQILTACTTVSIRGEFNNVPCLATERAAGDDSETRFRRLHDAHCIAVSTTQGSFFMRNNSLRIGFPHGHVTQHEEIRIKHATIHYQPYTYVSESETVPSQPLGFEVGGYHTQHPACSSGIFRPEERSGTHIIDDKRIRTMTTVGCVFSGSARDRLDTYGRRSLH